MGSTSNGKNCVQVAENRPPPNVDHFKESRPHNDDVHKYILIQIHARMLVEQQI